MHIFNASTSHALAPLVLLSKYPMACDACLPCLYTHTCTCHHHRHQGWGLVCYSFTSQAISCACMLHIPIIRIQTFGCTFLMLNTLVCCAWLIELGGLILLTSF